MKFYISNLINHFIFNLIDIIKRFIEYDLEKNFKSYPILYRLLHDKKNDTKFFNDLNYQDFEEIKHVNKKKEKFILGIESYVNKLYFETENKNLNFEENLFLQKTDYLTFAKMNAKISLFFTILSYSLMKFTKKSMEAKKPFAFLDNNRLLHNRLYALRTSLNYSLKFFYVCFSGILVTNLIMIYVLKYIYYNDKELENKLKERYLNKFFFYEEMLNKTS